MSWFYLAGRSIGSASYGRDNGAPRYVFASDGTLIDTDDDGLPNEAELTTLRATAHV